MHTLIFSKSRETRDLVALTLESRIDVEITHADTLQASMEALLNEKAVDLVIVDLATPSEMLFKFILSSDADLPLVLIAQKNQPATAPFPALNVIGTLRLNDMPENLLQVLHERKREFELRAQDSEYCQIAAELLVKVGPLRGDIYIRLSNVKFVKLFREGTEFTKGYLNQIKTSKKIQYLYLKKDDAPEFVHALKEKLLRTRVQDLPGDKIQAQQEVASIIDTVHELVHRIGFTPEVQEVARENIRLVIDSIGASPKLSEVLEAVRLEKQNYISSHSLMLANLSCCIAARMEWPSKTTFQKLTFAAFFHDIAFANPRLAAVAALGDLNPDLFSPEEVQAYRQHPMDTAEMIQKMGELPAEVDMIVSQHHERPDGRGFPAGLPAHRIAPLASVFIVAHDMVHAIIQQKGRFNLQDFIPEKKAEYKAGNFKKVWQTLSEF